MTMTELLQMDINADPDMRLLPPKKLILLRAIRKAIEVIEAPAQPAEEELKIVSSAENQPADDLQIENFTWKIEKISQERDPQIVSETFVIGGYKWRMSLRFTEPSPGEDAYLALYLHVADSAELQMGWTRFASFSLAVVNQLYSKQTVRTVRQIRHFNQESPVFGFGEVLSQGVLFSPSQGFIVNDSLIIQTEVGMRKVPEYLAGQSRPTVVNVGIQARTTGEEPLDEDPLQKFTLVKAMEVDIETLNQQVCQQAAEVLRVVSSAEDQPADGLQTVVNQSDPRRTVKRGQKHHFNQECKGFGFPEFLSLQSLDESGGFIANDMPILQTEVDIVGKFDENYVSDEELYDSKKVTGFVGLKNQGATCYVNSLIQTLYHLPAFRKAVYNIPTSGFDLLSESVPLALQFLFYKIQYGDTSPETGDVTKSLDWDTQSFRQQDAHEFNKVLCEKLEKKMKGTPVEGTIQQLFEGHFNNTLECIDVKYTAPDVKEEFYDLQLVVKGCKDVYASLDKYVEKVKLDGDNQYRAGEHGLQDTWKQVQFIDFPPVLQLHLERVDKDSNQASNMKLNDRYEFPLQLDLDRGNGKYLDSRKADRSVRNLYTLHSVLVHSGLTAEFGHYYAFIRPTLSDHWYKFDDELVTEEESKTVLEEHCGGEAEVQQHTLEFNPEFTNTPSMLTKQSSAYILMYVRECDKEKVMCSVDQKDIPTHLHETFK